MGDYMTVGELREILARYDGDRLITCNARVFERVISVEPGGVVAIITASGKTVDPTTCVVSKQRQYSPFWLGGPGDDDE